jgi:cellobiose phosphorylase
VNTSVIKAAVSRGVKVYGYLNAGALESERSYFSTYQHLILAEYDGWDGEYYLDAYNDHDDKIGSKENQEGRIYLIPQLWAVLSDIGDGKRQSEAMDAVEKYLADPLGIRISDPPYTKYDPNIGVMTTKYPGIHENGGVYLHTIAWKIAADAMLKRADKVEAGIETMLPFRNKVVNGRAEPYMLCNSYFGVQTGYRYGTPGQSWRSASSPWFMMALVRYVYGLQPEMEGLRIDPCLPPSWKNPEITKMFRGTQYHIRYENHGPRVKQILVDGKPIDGNILPPIGKKRCAVTVITY